MVSGIFPVTARAKANTSGESAKAHGLGWALRTRGEGQLKTFTANTGSGFLTGDTVTVSNGQGVNAFAIITANATGNIASVAWPGSILGGPAFVNTSIILVGFNREKHITKLNSANGSSSSLTNVGNANVINVTISNTGNSFALGSGKIATGSFTSNATGGISNTETQAIVWGANGGQFSNNQVNTAVVVVFTNAANGAVIGNTGGTWTVTANLDASAGGAVNATPGAIGGRAGRVTYEMLVIDRHIANGTSTVANSAVLPET
jgi:hypothetical protein